ncbi:uncharacterized protein J4E87_006759 [Alternaria ethzedia]|uniref:uncharacterized protein n=1 Tax=Alternaria ethzedia TaxID=181014 RepID=UPI0020C322A3|nr:uncharacterized protein J4E87_006759 [Alternaria ethzedia]KAI4621131.1 hypothetical protein J4E87_006759 [Alternaria ethzedia]
MKVHLISCLAAFQSLVASEALLPSVNETSRDLSSLVTGDGHSLLKRAPIAPANDLLWVTAGCRGQKLQLMDTLNPQEAQQFGTPLNSPWTGTLVNELALWGYLDNSENRDIKDECDFTMKPMFETALKALGISARSAPDGGPNKCFSYVHRDSAVVQKLPNGQLPARNQQQYVVNGRTYRITGAFHTIGINAQDGVIHMINRRSAQSAAKQLWNVAQAPKDQLPALASSSDIAWGLWERMSAGNLANINYIFSHRITNEETRAIIARALEGREVRPWPGEMFEAGMATEYWALLGSPNGIAAGYLLGQHKPQFGHNRYVSAIHVFQGAPGSPFMGVPALPYMCFVVKPAPYPPPPPPQEIQMRHVALNEPIAIDEDEDRVVARSEDGKSIVRSHKVFAKS